MQNVTLDDPKVAAVVRRCQQLPGQELFQYLDENGEARTLDSADVNNYIAEISSGPSTGDCQSEGDRFTAKDFPHLARHRAGAGVDPARLFAGTPGGC